MNYGNLNVEPETPKFDALEHNLNIWRQLDETAYVIAWLRQSCRELQDRATDIGGQKALELLLECKVLKKVITTLEKGNKYE